MKSARLALMLTVVTVITGLILIFLVRTFIVGVYGFPTRSMEPAIPLGSSIVVLKSFYNLERADVIAFKSVQKGDRKSFVKRIVGLPGEAVMIDNGKVIIVGRGEVTEPAIADNYYDNQGDYAKPGVGRLVPKDSYYVLGDNSQQSFDSRFFGFVPRENILGKVVYIIEP